MDRHSSPIVEAGLLSTLAIAASGLAAVIALTVRMGIHTPPAVAANPSEQVAIEPSGETLVVTAQIPVQVLRVVDGDTLDVSARIWLDQEIKTRVRLREIDAPELRAPCVGEQRRAEMARDAVIALTTSGQHHLREVGRDKYGGRVVARLTLGDGRDLGDVLLARGLARPYGGGRRNGFC